MEKLVPSCVRSLGLSNTDLESLQAINESATVKPCAVQNRFTEDTIENPTPGFPQNLPYPKVPFDRDVRDYCRVHDIFYTPWGLLWGNPRLLDNPDIFEEMERQLGVSKQVACFGCMLRLTSCKTRILCGTTKEERMPETIDGLKRIDEFLCKGEENMAVFQHWVDRIEGMINREDE